MPGATNDGGEDSTRGVVSSKSGFAHSGSIVNNECGDFIIHGSTAEGKKSLSITSISNFRYNELTSC